MLKLAQTSCYQHSGCPLVLLSQAGWEPWDAVWWQMTAAWSVELQSAHKCLTFGKVYLPTLVPLSGSRCWASDSPFVALCGWDWVCFELSEVPFGLVAELIILCEFCWAQTAPGMCHRYLEIDWHSSSSRQMPAALSAHVAGHGTGGGQASPGDPSQAGCVRITALWQFQTLGGVLRENSRERKGAVCRQWKWEGR